MQNLACPCGSGTKYKRCCGAYHRGAPVPDALHLMKARYAAYAVGDVNFVIDTTHPLCPSFEPDRVLWARGVREFSRGTSFDGLTIVAFEPGEARATVTFRATLRQAGSDASFAERSTFVRETGRWLYRDGTRLAA